MGVSVYAVLSKEVPGFDVTSTPGKALAAVLFEEGSFLTPLMRFSSDDEKYLTDFIADQTGQDPSEIEVPPEEWFDPEEGLQVLRPLLEQVRVEAHPAVGAFANWEDAEFTGALADDLASLEAALVLAQDQQARFHLAVDF